MDKSIMEIKNSNNVMEIFRFMTVIMYLPGLCLFTLLIGICGECNKGSSCHIPDSRTQYQEYIYDFTRFFHIHTYDPLRISYDYI